MTQIVIDIPGTETKSVEEWLSQQGYNYQVISQEVPQWQQDLVMKRLDNDNEPRMTWEEVKELMQQRRSK